MSEWPLLVVTLLALAGIVAFWIMAPAGTASPDDPRRPAPPRRADVDLVADCELCGSTRRLAELERGLSGRWVCRDPRECPREVVP